VRALGTVKRPRGGSRDDRVDDDQRVEIGPQVEEARRLVRAVEDGGAGFPKARGRKRSDRIVTAERASQADGGGSQSRSTSSRRKCVAQEMHGS